MFFIECDLCDRIDCGCITCLLSVTLEAEAILCSKILLREVGHLYSTSALHWSHYEALSISKYSECSCLILKRTLIYLSWVKILLLVYIIKVPYMYKLFRVRGDQQRKFNTHLMNWFANVCFSDLVELLRASPLPKFDLAVPTSTYDYILIILRHVVNIPYRLSMRSYLLNKGSLRIILLLSKIPFLNSVVRVS